MIVVRRRSIVSLVVTLAVLMTAVTLRYQAMTQQLPTAGQQLTGPVLPGSAYSDLLNGLASGGGG